MDLSDKLNWHDNCNKSYTDKDIIAIIEPYVASGGKVYIGADSMSHPKKCYFACVIALHDKNLKIADYFYKKFTSNDGKKYKNLKVKILEETMLALQVAHHVLDRFPNADIEVHIDIGKGVKNKTSSLVNLIKGWVRGSGFCVRIKPNSWASSSIADWHTK